MNIVKNLKVIIVAGILIALQITAFAEKTGEAVSLKTTVAGSFQKCTVRWLTGDVSGISVLDIFFFKDDKQTVAYYPGILEKLQKGSLARIEEAVIGAFLARIGVRSYHLDENKIRFSKRILTTDEFVASTDKMFRKLGSAYFSEAVRNRETMVCIENIRLFRERICKRVSENQPGTIKIAEVTIKSDSSTQGSAYIALDMNKDLAIIYGFEHP